MPCKCCVLNCRNGTFLDVKRNIIARRTSFFNVTKCPILLAKWKKVLKLRRPLTPKSKVCDLHFATYDIIKIDETRLVDGTIFQIPRLRCKLRKEAVPIRSLDHEEANVDNITDVCMTKTDPTKKRNEQNIATKNIQYENNDIDGRRIVHELIPSRNNGQPEFRIRREDDIAAAADDNKVFPVHRYSFQGLKRDLVDYKLNMPPGWTYSFEETCVKFTNINQPKYVVRMFCTVHKNMKMQV